MIAVAFCCFLAGIVIGLAILSMMAGNSYFDGYESGFSDGYDAAVYSGETDRRD